MIRECETERNGRKRKSDNKIAVVVLKQNNITKRGKKKKKEKSNPKANEKQMNH